MSTDTSEEIGTGLPTALAEEPQTQEPVRTQQMSAQRRQALEQHVLLLAPTFGSWKGTYQLPKEKVAVELDGVSVDNDTVTTPRSKLMTAEYPRDANGVAWHKRFTTLQSRQRRVIEKYSVAFPINGVRIIPKIAGENFLRELSDIQGDLTAAVDEFILDLDGILQQIKDNTKPIVWEHIEKRIPKQRHQMRAKFYMDVTPIELAGHTRGAQEVGIAELAQHGQLVRDAVRRKVEEAIENMVEGPRQKLADTLDNLRVMINRNGGVNAGSFKPVRDAIAKFRMFSCVANSDLMAEIDALERRMGGIVPKTLDAVTSANNGFTAALDAVYEEVLDAEKQSGDMEEFGKERRGIQL